MTNGWRLARFDEILTKVDRKFIIDDGQEYKTVGVRWYGNGAFIRERLLGANISRKQQWTIKAGDVVYNKLFAWKNAFAVADELVDGCIVSDKFPTYHIKPDLIDPKYLAYFFMTPQIGTQAQNLSKGAAAISKLTLNPPQFWDLTIPLPPLDEQHRIVNHVKALTVHITKAQLLRNDADKEADALWQSTLHKIFDESQNEIKILDEYTTFITDGTHVTPNYVETGVPFVTVRNIASRKLSFANLKYITPEQHEIYCKRVKPEYGDVLYTKDGTLGVPCFIDTDREFSFFVSVAIIKPKRDLLDGRYLSYILDAPQVHEQVLNTKTGAVLQHIVIRAIKAIKLPVPPLDDQRRVVAYLDSVQARLASLRWLQSQTQEELDALLPSVLDRVFRGEL